MDVSLASWLVIAVALASANLPFLTEKVFGLIPLKQPKHAFVRVFELLVLYFVVGAIAFLLESRIGSVFTQVKEFYMITVPLFVTLSFPGFVWRYLRKHRH
ncbi:DUF2818 family protein [Massilia soli]|uniref:DUF2818 family protein n=1 Tax=Massilia soli TaxID=2792854 RepID=A0ABS7SQP8_9BURK|nr:DUF2818 family protein [Massilia soli]MBZ2208260.1 DUF2818 family protein [Massilia soli]